LFRISVSAAGSPVDADAPLASDNDDPAAPKTGTTLLPRFNPVGKSSVSSPITVD
jgi:hypothetical protein